MTRKYVVPTSAASPVSSTPKTITRQELYDLAWQEPMLRVAERFGVSSSYLARVCTELKVPRPAAGYWAQREFGKAPPKPELPATQPGEITEWRPGSVLGTTVRQVVKAIRTAKANAVESSDEKSEGTGQVHKQGKRGRGIETVSTSHDLLIGVKQHFLKSREVENDILRPFKRLLVDVMSSEAKLGEVLDAAQSLFEALNRRGFHVGIAPAGHHMYRTQVELSETPISRNYQRGIWAPERPTVVYVGGTVFGLTLFEMTQEVDVVYVGGKYLQVRELTDQQLRRYAGPQHWRTKREHASGRLCLQAYCPFGRLKWSKRWQETKPGMFKKMVPKIIDELEAIAPEITRQLEEARIRAEEEHRQWQEKLRLQKIEAERVRCERNRSDARRDLLAAIASWDEARRVMDYFNSVELELGQLTEEDAAFVRERLRLGREVVGALEPVAMLKNWKAPLER